MNISKRILLFTLLLMITIFSLSASYTLVLQSGHEGMPVDIEWHERSQSIVSAGEDGRLIVTRPRDHKVLHRFRVSEDRIFNLVTDPSGDKAAIVTSKDGIFTVSVWNWDDEEKLYSYELDSEPLFTSWSAKGRYLTIGNLGTPSVLILEGRTGRRLSYLQRLPSFYNAGYIGSTESILMTYSVTGAIRYWDIRSSVLKLSTDTMPNLQDIRVLQTDSKTTFFAHKDDTLYLINRQTGAVLDQLEIPGIIDISVDENNGEIDVLTDSLSGKALHEYRVRNERFMPRDFGSGNLSGTAEPVPVDSSVKPVRILRKNGNTYLISRSGKLFVENSTGFSPVINDRLWRPDSMAFNDESIYLSKGSAILRFTSSFFSDNSNGDLESLSLITREEIRTASRATETGIEITGNGVILQWDKDSTDNEYGIHRFRFSKPEEEQLFTGVGQLQKLDIIDDGRILIVDRSGTISIMNSLNGDIESSYSALGILDSAYSNEGNFYLAGRSSRGRAGTALEQIDVETRESIPVPDSRFMIYSVVAGTDYIYSIGVERDSSGDPETSILRHSLTEPGNSSTLLRIKGEDLDASVLPSPDANIIYTSLGGTVRRINRSHKTVFQWNETVGNLALRGRVLYGLDRDGALVLWNAVNGYALIKVYFFNDGGWIALPPDGQKVWASPGAVENVIIYRNGRQVDPGRISQILKDSDISG